MKRLPNTVAKAGESKGPGTKRLTKLEPGEVSVVSRAANRKKFHILKNEDGSMPEKPMPADASHERLLAALDNVSETDLHSIAKAAEAVAIAKAEGDAGDSRLQTTLRAVGKMLVPYTKAREDGTPAITMADLNPILEAIGIGAESGDDVAEEAEEGAEELMTMSVDKSVDGPGVGPGIEKADAAMSGMTKPDGVSDAEHEAAKAAAKAAYDAHMEKAGYSDTKKAEEEEKDPEPATTKSEENMEKDDVAKSALSGFNAEQRAALEPIFKSQREAIAKAEAKAARLEETLLRKEIVAKAEGFRNLGIETQELADQLFEMQTKHPEGMPRFEKLLKSLDAQASRGGLFKEVGSQAKGDTGSTAAEQLDAAVASIVAKSDGRSKAQVYRDFVKSPEGAELYKAYQAEQRRSQREV